MKILEGSCSKGEYIGRGHLKAHRQMIKITISSV